MKTRAHWIWPLLISTAFVVTYRLGVVHGQEPSGECQKAAATGDG